VVTLFTTAVLIFGIKESARLNSAIVLIKVLVIFLFIFALIPKIEPSNWTPFFPENQGSFSKYGVTGMLTAATTVFFAYIGFDAVSTTAQEARNPQRDLPIGIIGSLAFCTVLYLAVCMVMTGVLNYTKLDGARPLSKVIDHVGWTWLNIIVEIGAISGLMSVMLITLMGQPRIFFAMGHDGLLPAITTRVHPRFKTPWFTTLLSGIVCAIAAGVLPIDVLGEMTSIGTLFAFVLVNLGVIILRYRRPDAPRKFKVPLGPWVFPLLGAVISGLLIGTATPASLLRLAVWMAVGLVLYFAYGFWNSRLNNPEKWVGRDDMVEKPDF
jgi:APA family basic amino acid/polyamine antiporter